MEETVLSVALGLGLAAACGFRVFVPFLVVGFAVRSGHLAVTPGFDWVATDAALVVFGVATVLEVGAYYVPWLDNLLDAVATPAAVVAGILVSASVITDMSPLLRWTLAVLAGGAAATTVQAVTVAGRQLSSVATFGAGNPVVSTAEAGGSLALAVLSVVMPLLGLALALVIFAVAARWVLFRQPRGPRPAPSSGGGAGSGPP